MSRIIVFLLLFCFASKTSAQTSASKEPYYIDVLVDAGKNIYFENTQVSLEGVAQMTRQKVEKLPFVPEKKIIYRIYGDRNLLLGLIMDVEQNMFAGFPEAHMAQRYLLETQQIPPDKENWVDQLNKLDLKAID